ncbi:MAG TPA: transaldolase family protein [Candidatus Krumholzibacteria bacterium]|nr:transaldolase family protein [Candidatus Krumholzibacteria bacterium]
MTDARPLRLLLDSADRHRWARLLPLGFLHGVTTNPLLLERAGERCTVANLRLLASEAAAYGAREIHLQAWGRDADALQGCGLDLAALDCGLAIAVKVPATADGFAAARGLVAQGATVTMTAVYTEGQVLAAAGLGAAYAAPYLGRLDDAGRDGRAILLRMQAMAARTPLRLLAASLRSADRVTDLAAAGLDTFTFGPDVALSLIEEPLTTAAAAEFGRAAATMGDDR